MSNFAFLPEAFRSIIEPAKKAEGYMHGDPRSACFHARFTLEAILHWMYRHESSLKMPYDRSLGALLHEPTLQALLPEALFQKARLIQKVGNQAVHSGRPIRQYDALLTVKELHHLCYWLVRTYSPNTSRDGAGWKDERVPQAEGVESETSQKELESLESKLAKQSAETLRHQQERDELDQELAQLRAQLAEIRTASEQTPDTHDYSEAETRRYLIDVELRRAGWDLEAPNVIEYKVSGMPNTPGFGYCDYVLWGDDGKPLGVVEAKRTTVDSYVGQQQAKLYADCLETMHGQRPIIFTTNGYETWLWDDTVYPQRKVLGFYKKEELERLIVRRTQRQALNVAQVKDAIVDRYYQKRVIGSLFRQFSDARRKGLLVMATGTGKTRTAIALVDVLQRAGWVKRVLFLADRVSLVKQACNAFKANLPESSPVNLVTEKDKEGRVYVCTYPTMMGLIDETNGKEARFGIGHFDLVIIDEAHRSVYQKYRALFAYFDSLLVGLTATPRTEVDKNTYDLFELETGTPTDAYELDEAVRDGFLVPPRVQQVDLKFPKEGIDYQSLSEEEKEQWESMEWGDEDDPTPIPNQVNPSAINSWLFNKDTVDKALQHLMEFGHKVDGGDRLGKTIIFARNHEHAKFIEERFNHHYPNYSGQFARVVDNYVNYAQSLIDDFSISERVPHIAISVDMLDTGIDVPEVTNLVFFKPVYSRIKFWQMIGRGTRLCPNLFGPLEDKRDFRVFDFCFNFEFFKENPDGITTGTQLPLGTKIFRTRVQLLEKVAMHTELDESGSYQEKVKDKLYEEVAAMNRENFIVRMHLQVIEHFQNRENWNHLNEEDQHKLMNVVAGLPSELELDELQTRQFDLTALHLQLAFVEGNHMAFEAIRKRVVEIALLLEEKTTVPAVAAQLSYLTSIQEESFWEGLSLSELENLRVRLRGLVPFLDKKKRKIVISDFQDQVIGVRESALIDLPSMTSEQYAKKVKAYLKEHEDDLVIYRLRMNEPLTPQDLEELESKLKAIGDEDGETLLSELLGKSEAPSLVYFVRSLVGMDRNAAQKAFSQFLNDRSLTPQQIRFIELIIEQLTSCGVIEASALYEPPFSHLHSGGPDELFAGKVNIVEGIFGVLKSIKDKYEESAG